MEKRFRLVFVYPDGHIEEINQVFNTGREAMDYGNSLIAQVASTEGMRSNKAYLDEDGFMSKEPIEPYYMIVELYKKKMTLVYDSRSR